MARQRQKQVNKNLVGGLAIAGILVSFVVFWVASANLAQRDPAQLAQKAEDARSKGDLLTSARYYGRAYQVNKETKYLVKRAAVLWEVGEVGNAFGTLNQAVAQNPKDSEALAMLLEFHWERERLGLPVWDQIYEVGSKLLALEPDNMNALVAVAIAGEALSKDEARIDQAEVQAAAASALARATELDATNPRLTLHRVALLQREAIAEAQESSSRGLESEAKERIEKARRDSVAMITAALEEQPNDPRLTIAAASILADLNELEAARARLLEAVQANPENPDLQFQMGRLLNRQAANARLDEAADDAVVGLLREAKTHADRAVELDPALFEAHLLMPMIAEQLKKADGSWDAARFETQQAILEGIENSLRDTLNLRSLRARLHDYMRAVIMWDAFLRAVQYYETTPAEEPEHREALLAHAERFLNDARTEYPDSFYAPMMEGQLSILKNDPIVAISAYEKAKERAESVGSQRYAMEAKAKLAMLYRAQGELGLAREYLRDTLEAVAGAGMRPSLPLLLTQVDVLNALDEPEVALATLERFDNLFPDSPELARARAAVLASMGRSDESRDILEGLVGEDAAAGLLQAQLAAADERWDEAETLLKNVLAKNPVNSAALRTLAQVYAAAGRQQEGAAFFGQHAAQVEEPAVRRAIEALQVVLGTENKEERDTRLLSLIEQVERPEARAAELYNFYIARDEWDKAREQLTELEKLRGESDETVVKMRFEVALRMKDYAAAETLLPQLSSLNADRVNGALYRGRLAEARGEMSAALQEYQAAERVRKSDSEIKLRIARCYMRRQPPDYNAAIAVIKQALNFDPRSFGANKLMYVALDALGRDEEARPYLEMAAKQNPNDVYVAQQLQIARELEDPQSGIVRREAQLESAPDDVGNMLRLAGLYEEMDRIDEAAELYERALQATPEDILLVRFILDFYQRHDNFEAGERLLDRLAQSEDPRLIAQAKIVRARFLDDFGKPDEARTLLESSLGDARAFYAADNAESNGVVVAGRALGEHFERVGDTAAAVAAYREVLPLAKGDRALDSDLRLRIVRALLQASEIADADEAIQSFRTDYPDNVSGMLAEAELAMTRGDWERAIEPLNGLLANSPDNAMALFMRGRCNLELQRYGDAQTDLARAKDLEPEGFGLAHRGQLVRLYELTKRPELAESELRELHELRPDDRGVVLWLVRLLLGQGGDKNRAAAQELLNSMRQHDPKEPFWPYQLAKLHMDQENYGAAAPILQEAMVLLTERVDEIPLETQGAIIADYVIALTRGNRAREALALRSRVTEGAMTPALQAAFAEAHDAMGQTDEAIALLRDALIGQSRTGSQSGLELLADRASQIVGPAASLDLIGDVRQELEGDANIGPRVTLTLGRRYAIDARNDDDRRESLRLIEEVLAATAPTEQIHLSALLMRANLFTQLDQAEKAVADYEKLLQLEPDSITTLNNLAFTLADDLGRAADALPYAQRAYELAGDNPTILDTLARVYIDLEQPSRAEPLLLEALRVSPDFLPAIDHLALLYARTNRADQARQTYEKLREAAQRANNAEFLSAAENGLRDLQ